MVDLEKNLEELIELSKHSSKYCVGMEGNASCKKNNTIYIKASGTKLKESSIENLVGFDFLGNQLTNFSKKGSMELSFHTFLLSFEEINYVSHTHPVNTLKILCGNFAEEFSKKRIFPDQVIFNGKKSCLIPYETPGEELTNVIKKEVNSYIESENTFPKLILLKNHGIISCGKSIEECMVINEICEKSAEIFFCSKNLGSLNFLSDEQIDKLLNDKQEIYRKSLL
jgi:ribulose-5-phosphate 4-epimerase/fuculose-1-phosphate aldolase